MRFLCSQLMNSMVMCPASAICWRVDTPCRRVELRFLEGFNGSVAKFQDFADRFFPFFAGRIAQLFHQRVQLRLRLGIQRFVAKIPAE